MMAEYGAADLNLGITEELSLFLADLKFENLPSDVVHECRRGIMDWVGCALAGSNHATTEKLAGVLGSINPEGSSTVFGRRMKLGLLEAPIANGQMGHVLDYDDTHMGGVILHASGPVLAAMFALAEKRNLSGKDLMLGYVAGFEAGVRTGRGAPNHHDGGWHLTGTLGSIAAGAACSVMLGLSAKQMVHTFGIAATQSAGMQQNRGTMCKSFQAGKAASNGLLAAMMAEQDFDSSNEILEGSKGFCRIYSIHTDTDEILQGLGDGYLISTNGYKPYACGVVLHPVIDTTIGLGKNSGIEPENIKSIDIVANAKAVTITGVANPKTGLKSKFSITHSAAVGYIDGTAGRAQFTNERALADDIRRLRQKVSVTTDDNLAADQARGTVTSTNGEIFEFITEHATGTTDCPMSDKVMKEKFMANAEPIVGEERASKIYNMIWKLDEIRDVGDLLKLCG
jgi:2-methylcitrate dehydratase PrpD